MILFCEQCESENVQVLETENEDDIKLKCNSCGHISEFCRTCLEAAEEAAMEFMQELLDHASANPKDADRIIEEIMTLMENDNESLQEGSGKDTPIS